MIILFLLVVVVAGFIVAGVACIRTRAKVRKAHQILNSKDA